LLTKDSRDNYYTQDDCLPWWHNIYIIIKGAREIKYTWKIVSEI